VSRVVVYREFDGTTHEVELPLTSNLDLSKLAEELGLPSYVDMGNRVIEMALAAVWACQNAPRLFRGAEDAKHADRPLTPLLLGGAAVKLLSPSANEQGSPFNRSIKDIDFIVPKGAGSRLTYLLANLSRVLGSRYYFFVTKSDSMFNALRAGTRYRLRALLSIENGAPVLTVSDVFVERVEMRHVIRFPEHIFSSARELRYTVGPELLILTKAQFIAELDRKDLPQLEAMAQGFRLLSYPHYRQDRLLVGMEEKDLLDVCSLIVDGEEGKLEISPERFASLIGKDEKLALTVRLNLENVLQRKDWLRAKGVDEDRLAKIERGVSRLLAAMPRVEKKWSKPWWNMDVETPIIT